MSGMAGLKTSERFPVQTVFIRINRVSMDERQPVQIRVDQCVRAFFIQMEGEQLLKGMQRTEMQRLRIGRIYFHFAETFGRLKPQCTFELELIGRSVDILLFVLKEF